MQRFTDSSPISSVTNIDDDSEAPARAIFQNGIQKDVSRGQIFQTRYMDESAPALLPKRALNNPLYFFVLLPNGWVVQQPTNFEVWRLHPTTFSKSVSRKRGGGVRSRFQTLPSVARCCFSRVQAKFCSTEWRGVEGREGFSLPTKYGKSTVTEHLQTCQQVRYAGKVPEDNP